MAINVYQIGDVCRIDKTFTDVNGAPIDPAANSLYVTPPGGPTTGYVYGTAVEITRTAVGVFYALIPLTAAGVRWLYRWESTGAGQSAEEAVLMVELSDFTLPSPLP